jgi:hypothetical protein
MNTVTTFPEARPRRLTNQQAAEHIGCAERTLENSRSTGMLAGVPAPAFMKIGKKIVRYERETLDAWLLQFSERATPSTSAACIADGGAQS